MIYPNNHTFIHRIDCWYLNATNKRGTKETRWTVKLIIRKKTDNAWLKMKKTNRQTIEHMIQHRKQKNKQQEPHNKHFVVVSFDTSVFIH